MASQMQWVKSYGVDAAVSGALVGCVTNAINNRVTYVQVGDAMSIFNLATGAVGKLAARMR